MDSVKLNRLLIRSVQNIRRVGIYIYIHAFRRSTRISVVNIKGDTLLTLSVGSIGYKKSQRKGSFVAMRLLRMFVKRFNKLRLLNSKVVICLKGKGPGKRPIVSFFGKGYFRKKCLYLIDLTNLSYGGCRLKKRRRL